MTPFTGGRKQLIASALIGVAGVSATAFGITRDPTLAYSSWLLAFAYWTSLALGSLLAVTLANALGTRWHTVLRRQLEQNASALLPCAAAFIGIALGVEHLYTWAQNKPGPWLNTPGFIMRGGICFAIFLGVWFLLDRNSRVQEGRPPDAVLKSQTRGFSSGALLFLALAATAAAVDWLMSLEPGWASAAFGLYFITGAFVSGVALLTLAAIVPVDPNLPGAKTSSHHVANLAALLLAGTCAWALVALSQYVIITRAHLPADAGWLEARLHAWRPVAVLLVVGRAVLPGLVLLARDARSNRKLLTAAAVWMLTMQFVDLFWVVKPALRLHSEALAAPEATLTWTDATAWLGIGGLCAAYVLARMRGRAAVPVNDPALEYSVTYQTPVD